MAMFPLKNYSVRLKSGDIHRFILSMILAFGNGMAFAESTPIGLWKTLDEDSGESKSLVRITENQGVLEGRIEKLLDPNDSPNALCERCDGERRNQLILGLLILRNVRLADSKSRQWNGGDILDPENGKVYKVKLVLSADGHQLDVRGYIGISLFGRTQTWIRVNALMQFKSG